MAKLSARGRTELVRFTKEYPGDGELTTWERKEIACMSDGTILEKLTVQFKQPDHKHSYGWKVYGRLKKHLRPKAREVFAGWIARREERGWTVERKGL